MQNRLWTCAVFASSLAFACSACSAGSGAENGASFEQNGPSSSSPGEGGRAEGSGGGSAQDSFGNGGSSQTGDSGGLDAGSGGGPGVLPQAPMAPIGLNRPAQANYGVASAPDAVDPDYGTVWRTAHVPTPADPSWIAIDLSGVPQAQREHVYSVWFNEFGYNYDTSDGQSYTLPGDLEIQANAAPGGGAAPSNGWVTLASVKGNLLSSGANLLDLGGYEWVRLHCTAANAAPQNLDVSLQWNLYDAHMGNDGWKFGGDSITANSMGHRSTNDSFDQLVGKQVPHSPAFEMAGHGGWSTSTMLGAIDAFLANFPGRYFAISLGTNDAPGNDPGGYRDRMALLVDKVLGAGKVPVIPTIPYTGEPSHASIPALNDEIEALYAQYGDALVRGPDLYALIYEGRATMFDDPGDLHPNATGNAAIRQAWADAMVKAVYAQ